MDSLTLQDLKNLASASGPCVSIYMQTHKFGPRTQGDQKGLKNLLREVEEKMRVDGWRAREIDRLLSPARDLIDDRPFWLRSQQGLAVFIDSTGVRTYHLPESVATSSAIGERFHLKPMLRLLGADRHVWILALSQKKVRLLRATRETLQETDVSGVPESLAEALKWDDFEKSSLQFHTQTSGSGGRRPAVFHGTGETEIKEEISRYFRSIDRGIAEFLHDDPAPLVLAGVEYLLPVYRGVNTHPHLATETIPGNPDGLGADTIHERAWAIAEKVAAGARTSVAEKIDDLWATPRTTSDPAALVPAAIHGRVDSLFIAVDRTIWGTYDRTKDAVDIHPSRRHGDEDLLDRAALETLLTGGDVFAVPAAEMPRENDAVALLRY